MSPSREEIIRTLGYQDGFHDGLKEGRKMMDQMNQNPLGALIAERMAQSPPPALMEPLSFWRFAIAPIPMYALVLLICHRLGSDWLSAFTLANVSAAIYFMLLDWYYHHIKRTNMKRMREWRKANGWLVS